MQDRFKFRIPMFTDKGEFGEFQYIELGEAIECFSGGFNKDPQQCTGLKDKNGKLIYEGDILEITSVLDNRKICHGAVIWWRTNTGFYIEDWGCLDRCFSPYFKIIGNTYENPELLEVNNER